MQTGESYKVRFKSCKFDPPKLKHLGHQVDFRVTGVEKEGELVRVRVSDWFTIPAPMGAGKDPRAVAARAVRHYLENKVPKEQVSQKEDHVELSGLIHWYPGFETPTPEVEENWKEFEVAKPRAKPRPRIGFIKDDSS